MASVTTFDTSHAGRISAGASLIARYQLHRVCGVLFASILPALFWMLIARGTATLIGLEITPLALGAFGGGITLFLCYVCAPIMLRAHSN